MPANAGDLGLIPGSGRSPGEGNSKLFQDSCLENSMDRGAWSIESQGVGHDRVTNTFTFHFTDIQMETERRKLDTIWSQELVRGWCEYLKLQEYKMRADIWQGQRM